MPSYTIETACRVTVYRQRRHEADTVEAACAAAIADGDWSDSRTDHDRAGQVHVTGVWEGAAAAHVGAARPFAGRFEEMARRKVEHFETLLRAVESIAPARYLPIKAHAAIAKAEAILAGADDPDLPTQVHTPWGQAEYARTYAEGVIFYSTASHGGFRLDPMRNTQIPDPWRNDDRWYEEDVQWAKVALTFPELFDGQDLANAMKIRDAFFGRRT